MNVPADLLYAESHEWLRLQGADGTVGITDHAQEELTDIVFVELPEVGRVVAAKEAVAVVESVKAASDIYAPVGGTITEVNSVLTTDPGLVNRDPHGEGWLFKMTVADPGETSALMQPAGYEAHLGA